MGFRERGRVNIKGLEGVDILWIDEAESITKQTLNIIIPTIRKDNAICYFSMNRFVRNDAVYDFLKNRKDCWKAHINYYENKHCPLKTKIEAEECKNRNLAEYKHIWLGEPLDETHEYLFNFSKMDEAVEIQFTNDYPIKQSVMSVDLSGNGGDLCVARRIERIDNLRWAVTDRVAWNESDTDVSVGKIIELYHAWNPVVSVVDSCGLGYPIYCTLSKTITNLYGFNGANEAKEVYSGNARADAYLAYADFIRRGWLKIDCLIML